MNENKNDFLIKSFQYLQKIIKQSAPAAAASYTLIGSILILSLSGYFLDAWLDTAPYFLIGGIVVGIMVGFYDLAKTVLKK